MRHTTSLRRVLACAAALVLTLGLTIPAAAAGPGSVGAHFDGLSIDSVLAWFHGLLPAWAAGGGTMDPDGEGGGTMDPDGGFTIQGGGTMDPDGVSSEGGGTMDPDGQGGGTMDPDGGFTGFGGGTMDPDG